LAIYIPGIAGELFGSIGNVTFSKVASGFNIAKAKPRPSKGFKPKRIVKNSAMSQFISLWKVVLSPADKADWDTAAAAFVQSRHGVPYDISGINLFCGFNSLYKLVFGTYLQAPTIFTGRGSMWDLTPAWDGAAHKVEVAIEPGQAATEYILLWYTNPSAPGASYRRRIWDYFLIFNNLEPSPVDLEALYNDLDGTLFFRHLTIDSRGTLGNEYLQKYSYVYS